MFSDKADLQKKYPKLKYEDLTLMYKKIGKSLGLRVNRLDEATKWQAVHIGSLVKTL